MNRLFFWILFVLVTAPLAASAQSLAEVAKKEEARRKTIKQSGKVYTNGDLRADITKTPPPPPPADSAAAAPGTQVPSTTQPGGKTDAAPTDKDQKDQAYWSGRIGAARRTLDRSRIFADALQSRLNALNADFANRDDPAQRAQIELERQRTLAELDRVKREMAEQTKAIADIEEEARKAGVPPGWLR